MRAWYLEDTVELKDVNSSPVNEKLGVKEIMVYNPTDEASDRGVVCAVVVNTVVGGFRAVIFEKIQDDLPAFLVIKDENEQEGLEISKQLEAQILRYVETLCERVEA